MNKQEVFAWILILSVLMNRKELRITREYPEYFLDYREHMEPNIRWTDRIYSQEPEWSGTGIGASVGLISSYYPDFECIDESREWFTNWGGSVVYYLGGDYDIITDPNTGKDVGYSNSLLYGFEVPYATPVEVHEYPTYTLLFPL